MAHFGQNEGARNNVLTMQLNVQNFYGMTEFANASARVTSKNTSVGEIIKNFIFLEIGAFHYESNAEAKAAKLEVANQLVPFYVERLDAQVKKNGGYFVGGALTWADLSFVALLDYLNFMMQSDIIEKAENLKQLRDKVLALPAIKSWVEKRPQSEC